MPYPWQQRQWEQLNSAAAAGRLPHAMLLSGAEGAGLTEFAEALIATLLCTQATAFEPCGECKSCILHRAGNHPDFMRVEPEEKGKQIKVDPIRELIDYIHLKSQYGRYKLAMINPAEAMNRSSANSLLKTLEEPPAGSLIILVCHQPAKLPITIRSRCQQIIMSAGQEQALAWLGEQLANADVDPELLLESSQGGPLKALEFFQNNSAQQQGALLDDLKDLRQKKADPIKIAEKWQEIGPVEVIQWLLLFFARMIRLKLATPAQENNKSIINRQLQQLINGLDLAQLFTCYDVVLKNHHAINGTISLNKQGLLEDIILQWQSLTETRS